MWELFLPEVIELTLQPLDGPQLLVFLPVVLIVLQPRKRSAVSTLKMVKIWFRCFFLNPYPCIFILFLFILVPLFLLFLFLSE